MQGLIYTYNQMGVKAFLGVLEVFGTYLLYHKVYGFLYPFSCLGRGLKVSYKPIILTELFSIQLSMVHLAQNHYKCLYTSDDLTITLLAINATGMGSPLVRETTPSISSFHCKQCSIDFLSVTS